MTALSGKFFVTGTDTEVGKTWVSCRLLEAAAAAGKTCYGLKPIAAGAEQTDDGLRNEDATALIASSSEKLDYDLVNPVALKSAIAPHIAAAEEKRLVTAARLAGYVKGAWMSHRADLVLVEGAGGWLVPLNDRETLADLARELDIPVILVVGMRLGCINHALLSVGAIRAAGLKLAGWIANDMGQPMNRMAENIATLEHFIDAPRIPLAET